MLIGQKRKASAFSPEASTSLSKHEPDDIEALDRFLLAPNQQDLSEKDKKALKKLAELERKIQDPNIS